MPASSHFSKSVLLLTGGIIGLGFFLYQLTLPPLFRGIICCDSVIYMNYARQLVRPRGDTQPVPALKVEIKEEMPPTVAPPSADAPKKSRWSLILETIFKSTSKYLPGYGAFLAVHSLISNLLGGVLPWIEFSLLTAFLLSTASILFLWRSLNRSGIATPAWAAALILAFPTLATHAALPISDSLAISLNLFAFSLILRTFNAPLSTRSILLAILNGFLFGSLLWVRPIYSVALGAMFGLWFAVALYHLFRQRFSTTLIIWAVTTAAMVLVFLPRLMACNAASGGLCITPEKDNKEMMVGVLRMGFSGARAYTVLRPFPSGMGRLVVVPDPTVASLGCTFDPTDPRGQMVSCLARNWWKVPGFLFTKFLGALDTPHLSGIATYITPRWMQFMLRLLMMPVLAGIIAAVWLFFSKLQTAWKLILVYTGIYLATLLPLASEYRYALLIVPIGIFSLGQFLSMQWPKVQRWSVASIFLVLACVFWIKVTQWDKADPIPYVPVSTAATEDVLKEVVKGLPDW